MLSLEMSWTHKIWNIIMYVWTYISTYIQNYDSKAMLSTMVAANKCYRYDLTIMSNTLTGSSHKMACSRLHRANIQRTFHTVAG